MIEGEGVVSNSIYNIIIKNFFIILGGGVLAPPVLCVVEVRGYPRT